MRNNQILTHVDYFSGPSMQVNGVSTSFLDVYTPPIMRPALQDQRCLC